MQTTIKEKRSIKRSFLAVSLLFLLSAGFVQAQIQDRPKAGPEQKKLEVFVGEWKYEGRVSDTPLGPGGKYIGKLTCRMVLDGLFLESRNEDKGVYGGKEMIYKGVGIQRYDATIKSYISDNYDNDGIVGHSIRTVNGNTWTSIASMTDSKGKSYKTRSSATFSPDGKTETTKAELSVDDGKTWMPYWEDVTTKVSK